MRNAIYYIGVGVCAVPAIIGVLLGVTTILLVFLLGFILVALGSIVMAVSVIPGGVWGMAFERDTAALVQRLRKTAPTKEELN